MSVSTPLKKPARNLPILEGILPIVQSQIPTEIIAGITLAALAIPEVMGYTKIAGTPVVTGLYTLLIPMALFALFGSSRHLVVGADSATAAIMAAGLAGLAAAGSPQYMAYAEVLALLAGIFLIVARVIRLGFLADFLSRTVLIGFLTGVGIQVAIGQISGMLGIPGGGSGPVQQIIIDLQQLESDQRVRPGHLTRRAGHHCRRQTNQQKNPGRADCRAWSYPLELYREPLGVRRVSAWPGSRWLAPDRFAERRPQLGRPAAAAAHRFLDGHRHSGAERGHVSRLCHALQRALQ